MLNAGDGYEKNIIHTKLPPLSFSASQKKKKYLPTLAHLANCRKKLNTRKEGREGKEKKNKYIYIIFTCVYT
jgi:hypothetical protein